MADGHPKAIRRARPAGGLATADRCTVHAPVLVPSLGLHARHQGGLVPWRLALSAAQHRERLHMDQEVLTGGPPPPMASQAAARHDVVPMRRVAQVAGPGRQDAHHPAPAPDAPASHPSCLDGLGCPLPQEGVERVLGAACQRSEGLRQCTGDHAGGPRQAHTLLVCQPDGGLRRLPRGTGPVLAGVRAVRRCLTGLPGRELAAKRFRTTRCHLLHDPQRTGPPTVATRCPVRGAMPGQERSDLPHHRARMSRWMASAPRGAVLTVRGVERLVVGGA